MKRFLLLSLFFSHLVVAQPLVLTLWPNGTPEDNGLKGEEVVDDNGSISNVSTPEIWVFPAENPNGKAVLMCPGGDYVSVDMKREGTDMAEWFNARGITFAVLKYRLPNGHCDIPLEDAKRAINVLKNHSGDWGVDRIGIMGAGAGGHLALCAALHNPPASRPDFVITLYPVISFLERVSPGADNVLFEMYPSDDAVEYYSCELNVSATCPPIFLVRRVGDSSSDENEYEAFRSALSDCGVPAVFCDSPEIGNAWKTELETWLSGI